MSFYVKSEAGIYKIIVSWKTRDILISGFSYQNFGISYHLMRKQVAKLTVSLSFILT